jgi:hypothetical protein
LEAAKASLKQANASRDESLVAQAKTDFAAAKTEFTLAGQIADGSQLLRRLETLPAVGGLARSRHTAVVGIAAMGVAISDAGSELSDLDGQLIKPAGTGGQQGRTLLTVIDQTKSSLVNVRANLALAESAAAQVDVQVLPKGQQATFAKARATIDTALAGLDEFQRLVPILTDVLGGNGARTFLIEQVNPAELRAGGGFIGSFSLLRADHGTLKVVRSGDAYELADPRPAVGQPGYVAPPGPLREFVPDVSWSFVDSNFSPDFPSNAKAAEGFAQARLGTNVDGVISIDYYTVARILELTGPLPVPGVGVTVDANNFIPGLIQDDLVVGSTHKAILKAAAGPLMNRVSTLPPDRWLALMGALNDLASARHLQVYFNSDGIEQEIARVGWSGSMNVAGATDYMMEVENNLGGTKANYFVTRHFTVELTRSGATVHHKVTVDLIDNMPSSSRPGFTGDFYRSYVSLYVPATALSTSDNLRPVRYPDSAAPAGTMLLDGWLPDIPGVGGRTQAVIDYETPWQTDGAGQDRIYWQKQPGTLNDKIDVVWRDGTERVYTAGGDLGQDLVINLAPGGLTLTPGRPAQAQLPSLGLD